MYIPKLAPMASVRWLVIVAWILFAATLYPFPEHRVDFFLANAAHTASHVVPNAGESSILSAGQIEQLRTHFQREWLAELLMALVGLWIAYRAWKGGSWKIWAVIGLFVFFGPQVVSLGRVVVESGTETVFSALSAHIRSSLSLIEHLPSVLALRALILFVVLPLVQLLILGGLIIGCRRFDEQVGG